jgi:polyisoprenoid-binding protein YceI
MFYRRSRLASLTAALLLAAVLLAQAEPVTFRAHEDARDVVEFVSKAPLEKITGRAQKVRAEVTIEDIADLQKGKVSAMFEVDLATVDTGIGLRNQHMRDMYLETDKFPLAVFTLQKIERVQAIITTPQGQEVFRDAKGLTPNTPTRLTVVGTFDLHGVKRELRLTDLTITHVAESEATKMVRAGSLLRVQASFPIKLSDYAIKRPQMVLLRVSDDVTLSVDMTGGTGVEGRLVTKPADGKEDAKASRD